MTIGLHSFFGSTLEVLRHAHVLVAGAKDRLHGLLQIVQSRSSSHVRLLIC